MDKRQVRNDWSEAGAGTVRPPRDLSASIHLKKRNGHFRK